MNLRDLRAMLSPYRHDPVVLVSKHHGRAKRAHSAGVRRWNRRHPSPSGKIWGYRKVAP